MLPSTVGGLPSRHDVVGVKSYGNDQERTHQLVHVQWGVCKHARWVKCITPIS